MMNIQGKPRLSLREILYYMGLVVLLSASTRGESKKGEPEDVLAFLIDSGEIDQEMVELLQHHCKLELLHFDRVHYTEDKTNENEALLNSRLSDNKNSETANIIHPLVKQLFLDCSVENSIILPVSGEDKDSVNWYTKYLELFFTQQPFSGRRRLADTFGEVPAPSPSYLSPGPAPSISLAPDPDSPASSPVLPFFPPVFSDANVKPTAGQPSPTATSSDLQSSKDKNNKRTVVIAVVVTASVTFLIAALLFLCYRRYGTGSGQRRNDERPLLSLSLRDYATASPLRAFGLGASTNEEKPVYQSSNIKLDHSKNSGNSFVESHSLKNSKMENSDYSVGIPAIATTNTAKFPVQMSLGTPGLPPLKPPPGKIDQPKQTLGALAPAPPRPPPALAPSPPPHPAQAPAPPPRPPGRPPPGGLHTPPLKTPPPPPIPSGIKAGPRPPPPPGAGAPPPRPPTLGLKPPKPVPGHSSAATSSDEGDSDGPKAKLKPFFWDKVLANPDHSMVWHQIKSGSFQFDEEMIESLFGYAPGGNNTNVGKKESSSQDHATQFIQIIDPKKAQNLSILLKALNVTTEEVCDALKEGNELPAELIQTFLKMAPTSEEELKLRVYNGNLSQLGPAERFLKVLVDIPFAFKRLETLLFMCTLQEDTSTTKEAFQVLEAASVELRKSRLFLKLLEAVLKTGNRMNDGTFRGGAQAFKLDTLLKLVDVKGTDGKTTLLHFVVQEIIRSEGIRAARASKESQSLSSIKSDDMQDDSNHDSDDHLRSIGLQVVSGLGNELENVRKAAVLDSESLTGTVAKLRQELKKSRDFLSSEMKNELDDGFHQTLKNFVQNAEVDIMWLQEEEKRVMALVKSTSDYFHGSTVKDEGLRLFIIVRDFIIILEKVCKELVNTAQKSSRLSKKDESVATTADVKPSVDPHRQLFPAIIDRRIESSSSDDES